MLKWCHLLGGAKMSDASRRRDDPEPERFYKVPEAARLLRVSTMTLYRAINEGKFPAIRVRNRLAVPAKAIDEMEASALMTQSVVDTIDWMDTRRR
jgi:excisionase family DNA binding protein